MRTFVRSIAQEELQHHHLAPKVDAVKAYGFKENGWRQSFGDMEHLFSHYSHTIAKSPMTAR